MGTVGFVSQMWGWFGGGGGCNVLLIFYAIYNIHRNINFGNTLLFFVEKNNYFSFNVFFMLFFMLEILKSAPSLTG